VRLSVRLNHPRSERRIRTHEDDAKKCVVGDETGRSRGTPLLTPARRGNVETLDSIEVEVWT